MNQTDVKVSFYLKKSEADARGNCPVMARLIVGKHYETAFSVKFRVPQSLWSSGRACGKSVAARDINNRLDEIRAAALGIFAEQSAIRENSRGCKASTFGYGFGTGNPIKLFQTFH